MQRHMEGATMQAEVMQRQILDHAEVMQRQMLDQAQVMQRQAAAVQRQMELQVANTHAQIVAQQIQAQSDTAGQALQDGAGLSTSVVNGVVYINGERVGRNPGGVQISQVNGSVFINGRPLAREHRSRTRRHHRSRLGAEQPNGEGFLSLLEAKSRVHTSTTELEEPCAICTDCVLPGECVRTLPCFHRFHDACATSFFQNPPGNDPVCPICRHDLRE